jgi:mono/diheme cytochrome c family protein
MIRSNSLTLPLLVFICSLQISTGWSQAKPTSIWEGIYSQEQSSHGRDLFITHCIACHSDTLDQSEVYGSAPGLIGEDFTFRWTDSAVLDLYDAIRQTMPQAAPSSLSELEYAALTAYLLAINSYPTGEEPMDPSQRNLLLEIYIEPAR